MGRASSTSSGVLRALYTYGLCTAGCMCERVIHVASQYCVIIRMCCVCVCVCVRTRVCVCAWVLPFFARSSRLDLYDHNGVLKSGRSPLKQAHSAGQGCVPVLPCIVYVCLPACVGVRVGGCVHACVRLHVLSY